MEPYGKTTESPVVDGAKNPIDKITERVNVMLGGEGKVDLRLGDLFSQVFKRHSQDEADELFICGTKYTTPTPDKISSSWPKPWLFSRVAIILLATFYILLACFDVFGNEFAIPGIMFVGSLAIPFSTLIFLFEINAPRNVSIFRVVNVFMLGGAASLFVTLILYQFHSSVSLTIGGAIFVGIVEELGKVLIVAYAINKLHTTNYILNGLLIGGAVGAGFAVFESAGYAFVAFIAGVVAQNSSGLESMTHNIIIRGFLSPGGHIAWAAMEGAFLIIVLEGKKFTWPTITSGPFLKLCLFPAAMHAFYDMPLLQFTVVGLPVKLVALETLALIVVLVILHRGLAQINQLQGDLTPKLE
ncbi:MAG: PrsW family intramembrane metalloprotease [Thermoguttaceae bacterium]|nr:PrsW family intramembrane metalloprotease [Thermoguttaceae bacterium]MBR5759701.1 PrsW family intramembrane metalloprotease [Thermoguttaceae bacterium]